jgi:hypothetical protein
LDRHLSKFGAWRKGRDTIQNISLKSNQTGANTTAIKQQGWQANPKQRWNWNGQDPRRDFESNWGNRFLQNWSLQKTDMEPLASKAKVIRTTMSPTKFSKLTAAVKILTDEQDVYLLLMKLQTIYKCIIHMHRKYEINIHLGLSDKSNHISGTALESTTWMFQKPYTEHCVRSLLKYYKETEREERNEIQWKIHTWYGIYGCYWQKFAINLTETSLLMRWFPNELQNHIKLLGAKTPLEEDFGDLMTLMMFAGFRSMEYNYIKHKMCKKVFEETTANPITDSHQNFAVFIFGITMDDVSEMVWNAKFKHMY